MNLAKLAFTATLRNPVFGLGMGMFADETADYIQRTTRNKAPWQTAHNSYLKVSSENGIPAFLFYVWSILAAIFMTWRTSSRRASGQDLRTQTGTRFVSCWRWLSTRLARSSAISSICLIWQLRSGLLRRTIWHSIMRIFWREWLRKDRSSGDGGAFRLEVGRLARRSGCSLVLLWAERRSLHHERRISVSGRRVESGRGRMSVHARGALR